MMIKRLTRPFKSVFIKLLSVLFVACVIINLLIFHFVIHARYKMFKEPFMHNIGQYMALLVKELGDQPDFEKAQTLSKQLSMQIRYKGRDDSWTTSKTIPAIEELSAFPAKKKLLTLEPGLEVRYLNMRQHRGPKYDFIHIRYKDSQFAIAPAKSIFEKKEIIHVLIIKLITITTLIMAGVYFAIRWILKPMKLLTEGVRKVGKGELDDPVSIKRSDEFREMADAFNDMRDRIKKMLHTRDRLLLDVSHELRSPLTRMKVALEFLPENSVKDNIQEDIMEMETMITEILETARLKHRHGKLNLVPVDLLDLVKEIIRSHEHEPPGIEPDCQAGSITVSIDPDQVRIVLNNVIINALKYSKENGQPVMIRAMAAKDHAFIEIIDHGDGIPDDEIPYVFEPFYRVDKSRSKETGGYGLGLNLCKTIMEAHGGRIEIKSRDGEGTTVRLIFRKLPQDLSFTMGCL